MFQTKEESIYKVSIHKNGGYMYAATHPYTVDENGNRKYVHCHWGVVDENKKFIPSIAFKAMSGSAKGVTAAKTCGRKYIRNRGNSG
ncbi:MAG: hypothetical protein ACI3YY_03800 [Candidatus Cryptobacteroides sp.]